jgi:hypothetical protein
MTTVPSVPVEQFRHVLQERFGGRLSAGCHRPDDGVACALEAAAVARGLPWTDNPSAVGLPDLRPLNDGPWSSDTARTEALVSVAEALWDWAEWTKAQRRAWCETVALRTVRELLPDLLRAFGLPEHAAACAAAGTLPDARAAAWAAVSGLSQRSSGHAWPVLESARTAEQAVATWWSPAPAARAACHAARAWAELGLCDAAEETLQQACRIWREAARDSASLAYAMHRLTHASQPEPRG